MSSFHERQKSLFNHLKDAEDQCSFSKTNKLTEAPDFGAVDRRTYRKLKHEMKQFRGRESIYKREAANIKDCVRAKTVPDYIINPQNYQYYSLSDVTADQMSDATNTSTALAFIRGIENKTTQIPIEMDVDETGAVFKKPTFQISKTIPKQPVEEVKERAVFKSNKIIMPEYVVGVTKREKKVKVKKETKENPDSVKKVQLKLDHLYEDEEED